MKKKIRMVSIGISGMMGSGKSEALKFFRNRKIPSVDLDLESKKLIKKDTLCYKKLIRKFGYAILNKNLTINRKKLREIIFNSEQKRMELNNIVHPELIKRVKAISEANLIKGKTMVVFEGALISKKTKMGSRLDKIIFIDSPKKLLIKRIVKRYSIDEKSAIKLLNTQKNIKKNRNSADFIINNDKTLNKLNKQLHLILDKLSH
jgi:dephospho-CoA kinase